MSAYKRCWRLASIIACMSPTGRCFSSSTLRRYSSPLQFKPSVDRRSVALYVEPPPLSTVNLIAGMLGGSIGVGVAYPFDTIKVKMQSFLELNPGKMRHNATNS